MTNQTADLRSTDTHFRGFYRFAAVMISRVMLRGGMLALAWFVLVARGLFRLGRPGNFEPAPSST